MSEGEGLTRGFFTKLIRGILKLMLASFIITAVSAINIPDLQLQDTTLSGAMIKALIQFIVPLALVFSALHDFGVEI